MLLTEISHPSHPQHLYLERPYAPFLCDGCKELGFGACYQCNTCNFHLHKECAIPSSTFYHSFFKNCEFNFYREYPRLGGRVCDGCWKDVRGFVYQCSHENANDLHPCCAKLPRKLAGDGVKLELKDKVDKPKCPKCQSMSNSSRGTKGWSYVSTCGNYCFHVACVKEMIYEAWEMGYFDHQETEIPDHSYSSGLVFENMSSSKEIVPQNDGRKSLNYLKKVTLVLELILSAIFGNPIAAFTSLIIALVQSLVD